MSNRESVIDRILAFDVTDTEVVVNPATSTATDVAVRPDRH